jgi:hypothetical protein
MNVIRTACCIMRLIQKMSCSLRNKEYYMWNLKISKIGVLKDVFSGVHIFFYKILINAFRTRLSVSSIRGLVKVNSHTRCYWWLEEILDSLRCHMTNHGAQLGAIGPICLMPVPTRTTPGLNQWNNSSVYILPNWLIIHHLP